MSANSFLETLGDSFFNEDCECCEICLTNCDLLERSRVETGFTATLDLDISKNRNITIRVAFIPGSFPIILKLPSIDPTRPVKYI